MKKYAAFFEWPDRQQKELGVVEELITGLSAAGVLYSYPRTYQPDPPDCVCDDLHGRPVAIEVSEVVCQEATARTARGERVFRSWRKGELAQRIAEALKQKDKKTFNGGPHAEIVACLFTDEPLLPLAAVQEQLAGVSFGPFKQLTSAHLLLSYDPRTSSYPIVSLALRK